MPDSQEPNQVNNNDLSNAQFGGGLINAETVNAHKIGGDIYNIHLEPQKSFTPQHYSRQEYHNRQALLKKVNNYWIKGVLETSLPSQVQIILGLEERLDTIVHPWNVILEASNSQQKILPQGTKVIEVFDSLGEGRTLLILGEPGSGKTTVLLELARILIIRAEKDINHLIPVIFNLSSWKDEKQNIADWLVDELNTKYQVPKKIAQSWVKKQQLLLLLDGLDEVQTKKQEECINALNNFYRNYNPEIIVCSRYKDYEVLSNRLNFQSAVYLKYLTLEQVHHYLNNLSSNFESLKRLINQDTLLQELAKSPLMLNLMTLAYQGVGIEDLPNTDVLEEKQKQLFDDYIEKMFNRPNRSRGDKKYWSSKSQSKHWLICLAQKMKQESQTIFLIERMQPNWLQTPANKLLYISSIGLFLMLSILLILYLIFLLVLGQGYSLKFGIFLLLGGGFIIPLGLSQGNLPKIRSVEHLQWSWIKFKSIIKAVQQILKGSYFKDIENNINSKEVLDGEINKISRHNKFLKALLFITVSIPIILDALTLIKNLFDGFFLLIVFGIMSLLSLVINGGMIWLLIIIPLSLLFPSLPSEMKNLVKAIGILMLKITGLALLLLMWIRGITLIITNPEKAINNVIIVTVSIIQSFFYSLYNILPQGLIFVLLLLILTALFSGLSISEINQTTYPNQGIWNSAINAVVLSLILGIFCGLTVGLIFEFNKALISGLGIGLAVGLWSGKACIQHLSLRIILYLSRATPWNYARFLNYATERIFIQKVGGGYIFIHRLLMEHFAQMKVDS